MAWRRGSEVFAASRFRTSRRSVPRGCGTDEAAPCCCCACFTLLACYLTCFLVSSPHKAPPVCCLISLSAPSFPPFIILPYSVPSVCCLTSLSDSSSAPLAFSLTTFPPSCVAWLSSLPPSLLQHSRSQRSLPRVLPDFPLLLLLLSFFNIHPHNAPFMACCFSSSFLLFPFIVLSPFCCCSGHWYFSARHGIVVVTRLFHHGMQSFTEVMCEISLIICRREGVLKRLDFCNF